MACVGDDGRLTESGRKILAALAEQTTPEGVARATELPLYRVRGGLRELAAAGLAVETDGRFEASDLGAARAGAPPPGV